VQQFNDSMALTDKQHALETQINEQVPVGDSRSELARERAVEDEKLLACSGR